MHKISIIGAGNVGGMAALRLLAAGAGEVVLVDRLKNLAIAKELDLKDSQTLLKENYKIIGTDDYSLISGSEIVVITAGFARRPDMTREDLLKKNAQILKEVALQVKRFSPEAIVIVVTNPIDLLTYLVIKVSGLAAHKVIGMGVSLDASRFINLISEELKVSPSDIETLVIGSHGEGMLPLARLTKIKGVALGEFLDDKKISELVQKTINRGARIVSLLASGSAYVAPSAAVLELVKVILKDEKRTIGISCLASGEYGVEDVCIGLPCRLGRQGIEKIIELKLSEDEKESLIKSAKSLRKHAETLKELFT